MRGFVGMTPKEKEDIMKLHSKPYNGYAIVNPNPNVYTPIEYSSARDTKGITLDNKNNPSVYKNFRVNEIAAKNLHYDEIEPAYEFDSSGPGDENLGYNVYSQTKPSYDFDSKGPSDPYYGGGYQTGEEDSKKQEFDFDTIDFEEYIDDVDGIENLKESVFKTLKMIEKIDR